MVLKISEFNPNCITAVMDETRDYLADLISCKREIFKYEGFPKVPLFVIYGVIRLDGNYLEIDIKDDKTEEFFKSLVECLLRVGGGCLNEKPWHMKSPLINYGSYYRCRANQPKKLKVGRYYQGYCEIEIGKAFVYSNHGLPYRPMSGVSLVVKNVKLC